MHSASLDDSLDGLWKWQPHEDTLSVNERWCEIHGLAIDMARTGLSVEMWLDRVHPENRVALRQGLDALSEGRSERHVMDIRVRREDQSWVWVTHSACGGDINDREPFAISGTLKDITSLKRQEATLCRKEHPDDYSGDHPDECRGEHFLDRVEQIAGVGGWEVDLHTQHVTWSDETRRLHAVAPDYSPSFQQMLDFYAPSARPAIRACVEKAIEAGESFDVELPLIRADGHRITVRCIGSVEHREGEPARLGGAIQDVTDHALRRLAALGDSNRELERVNERLSLATESGGIGIWDFDVPSGEIVWDEHMFMLHGLSQQGGGREMSAEHWLNLVHVDDRERIMAIAREMIADSGNPCDFGFRIVTSGGRVRDLHATARVVRDEAGRVIRVVGTNQDVTESRRLTREIARQHEMLQVTLRSIGDGVITTDPFGNVMWMNPVAEAMVGWSTERARSRPLADVFHIVDEDTHERVPDPVQTCLCENRITELGHNTMLISRDGTRRWIEDSAAPIRSDEGELFGAVLVFHDVTQQRSIANEMAWRANHDELTGLANRVCFESSLERVCERTGEDDRHVLLFIDLDRFKIVNDTCGHAAGDQLLRQVSRLFARTVRSRDLLARLGGDEFAIVLENCSVERAQAVAQEICDLMDEFRFVHEEQRFRIGTSIGLVSIDNRWSDVGAILQAADSACYAAKESGRNRVHRWSETDQAMHVRRSQTKWATRLEAALDDDGFELYAQRIGELDTLPDSASNDPSGSGEGTHAEILIRLRDGDNAPVLPGAFLPAAERFNLINRIDQWVLGRVMGWLRKYRGQLDVGTLWINLSGQSFSDSRFQHDTLARLREAGQEVCGALCFEITETAAVTSPTETAGFIRELRALGVRIALDDFGSGSSSFGYLKSLPVDYLKIDGQFVRDLTEDPLDAAAVRCFAEVARVMNVKTVAEFVETPEVLGQLREIGVDFVQGWLLHTPAPISELLNAREKMPLACG